MDKNNINISSIETYINEIFDNTISNNTMFGAMIDRETIPSDWEDMCLVDLSRGVDDFNAYGYGVVLLWLYARPLSSGRKNVAVMSRMERKLNEILAGAKHENYQLRRRGVYSEYDTKVNWHCNVIEIEITVF